MSVRRLFLSLFAAEAQARTGGRRRRRAGRAAGAERDETKRKEDRAPPLASRSILSMERGPRVVRMMSATACVCRSRGKSGGRA